MNNYTFKEWIQELDEILMEKLNVGHEELPDIMYQELYENGASPDEAAYETLTYVEAPEELMEFLF